MSGFASAAVYPGRYNPSIRELGAVNQRSPQPLTRNPNSVPFRAIVVTIDDPSTPAAASAVAFPHAMLKFKKKKSSKAK
jgi:hypothetical protein